MKETDRKTEVMQNDKIIISLSCENNIARFTAFNDLEFSFEMSKLEAQKLAQALTFEDDLIDTLKFKNVKIHICKLSNCVLFYVYVKEFRVSIPLKHEKADELATKLAKVCGLNEIKKWEEELDTFGTASETEKYLAMLQKAPANAPSLPTLTNFIQQRMSA